VVLKGILQGEVTENDRRHSLNIVEGRILRTFHFSTWPENLKFS